MAGRSRKPKFAVMKDEDKPDLQTAEAWFASAKIAATKAMKICAPAIKALHPVFCDPATGPAPGTFAVDKFYRVYVCTGAVFDWVAMARAVSPANPCQACGDTSHHPIAYLAGAVCHEAWHPMRQHMDRAIDMGITNFKYWNWATDEEINDDLMVIFKSCTMPKLCIPPTHLHLPKHHGHEDGKLAEHYYFRHTTDQKEDEDGKDKGEQGEKGEGEEQGEGRGQDEGEGEEQEGESEGSGEGEGESDGDADGAGDSEGSGEGDDNSDSDSGGSGSGSQPGSGSGQSSGSGGQGEPDDHGSGVDGRPRPWDLGEPKQGQFGGLSEAEGRMVRKAVAKRIAEAVKGRGTVPGGWSRWADKILEGPKYDWRAELRKALSWSIARAQGDEERTYRKLGRRTASLNYKAILPSTFSHAPVVCVVQDTSGSMSEGAISISMAEAEGIISAVGCEISWLACDMAADVAQKTQNIRNLDVHGGGGTDMRIGIKAALDSKPQPNVVVLFTDGYTPWPAEPLPKGVRLVVGLVGEKSCSVNEPPPWATIVKIVGDDIIVKEAS